MISCYTHAHAQVSTYKRLLFPLLLHSLESCQSSDTINCKPITYTACNIHCETNVRPYKMAIYIRPRTSLPRVPRLQAHSRGSVRVKALPINRITCVVVVTGQARQPLLLASPALVHSGCRETGRIDKINV